MSRSLEIARLEAQVNKDWDAYQKRPRRRFIGARTQEFRFARYLEDWRIKVERIGEMNYPQAARDQKMYGSLVVTVSIKSDGAVDRVEINRSSGVRMLDEAALRIVKLAAPYAAFPPDIARDTDIVSITRTWMFTRSDQFVAE
jgi:protein TonB